VVPFLLAGVADLEQHSFLDYGWVETRQMVLSISLGFIIGGLSLALLSVVQWQFGMIHWQHLSTVETQQTTPSSPGFTLAGIVPIGLIALWISATEELVFRGFLQFQLQQDYPPGEAAAIASTLFALSHLLWNWKDTVPQLPGLRPMGRVLTVACICDRGSLGLAIGWQASWIWGIALTEQLFVSSSTPDLPQWLLGSINHPLARLSSWMMLLTLAGGLILFYPN
jgi:membrane protease YdiL (CAAX protease family)